MSSYQCAAILKEEQHEYLEAGWLSLRAAWLADDLGDRDSANECRELTLSHWRAAEEEGQFADPDSMACVEIDVARRLGRFNEGADLAKKVVQRTNNELFRRLALFQLALCEGRDLLVHTLDEARGIPEEGVS